MIKPRLFVCGGAPKPRKTERKVIALSVHGHDPNVNLRINDVARVFLGNVPPRLYDLLEIASYVYAADVATSRGREWQEDAVESWQRDLQFRIAVREPDFWNAAATKDSLTRALSFLSNDKYAFDFAHAPPRILQGFLDLGDENWPYTAVEQVTMFSGGLDSLAGSIETAESDQATVLVSHRPVSTISRRQRRLVEALKLRYRNKHILHVPVWINRSGSLGYEATQRSRSFLFTAIGSVVACQLHANRVRFFENGIVSLNLPVADEVLRARASRTTHPIALKLLQDFVSLVSGRGIEIDNPYFYQTKTDVVRRIANHGAADLIGLSVSCAHTMFKSVGQQHCGLCSQCIDRRLAVIAGGVAPADPTTDYVEDVFLGGRKEGYERNMAVHYTRHATELLRMSEEQFATKFNLELSRAIRFEANSAEAATRIYEMHQRHATAVVNALAEKMSEHAGDFISGKIDRSSLLGLIAAQLHDQPAWHAYSIRIGDILQEGIPRACRTEKPDTEPILQELSDGILAGHNDDLVREFPFMRWSASMTKPDWSHEAYCLWVELKYVRTRKDILPITEAIAADITKYSDSGRRILFVIYDPTHLVVDERQFASAIEQRNTMSVRFIR
jgi:hypothetical protein